MSQRPKPGAPAAKPASSVGRPTAVSWKDRLLPEDYESLRATFDLFD